MIFYLHLFSSGYFFPGGKSALDFLPDLPADGGGFSFVCGACFFCFLCMSASTSFCGEPCSSLRRSSSFFPVSSMVVFSVWISFLIVHAIVRLFFSDDNGNVMEKTCQQSWNGSPRRKAINYDGYAGINRCPLHRMWKDFPIGRRFLSPGDREMAEAVRRGG